MVRSFSRLQVYLFSLLLIGTLLLAPLTSLPTFADTAATTVTDNVEEWAVGSGLLYWANSCYADEFNPFAVLKRQPSGGGTARTIESINDYARCITYQNMLSTGEGLYYFDLSQSRIARMPLGEPYTPQLVKALTSDQQPIGRSFVEAGDYLYWVHFAAKIYRTRKDGSGPVETVANTAASPSDVLLVGSTAYWSDSTGIWTISVGCAALPCAETKSQFSNVAASPYGLAYQFIGGIQGSYRIYWVERATSGPNNTYTIRYRSCGSLAVCFVLPPEGQLPDPPPSFYASTVNWRIGIPLLVGGNLYWTEADQNTITNSNGDLKRKASNTTGTPGADTIATGQAKINSRLYAASDKIFFARQSTGIYSLPLGASAITRDFRADGLEVTQAIQNLANSAPLVAAKTTYVRAYATQISGPSTPNVEARLVGLRNGLALPGSPLQPVNGVRALGTGGGFDRAQLNNGWYFLLPASWIGVGNITLQLEIDGRQIHNDPNRSNNQLIQAVSFQKAPPICVIAVPVRTHTPLPSVYDPNFAGMVSHFERRWPTPDVWVFRDGDPVEELQVCFYYGIPYPCHGPYELSDGWGLTNGIPDRDKVIVSLWGRALTSFNPDACDDIGAPVHFMGMVHPSADNGGASGYASTVSNQSWVQLPPRTPNPIAAGWDNLRAGSVMAQELAHNYGRKHVNCGGPDDIDNSYPYPPCQLDNAGAANYYGFDVTTLQPIRPDQAADFMSYASRRWVSDYTWRALLSSMAGQQSNLRAAATTQAALAQGNSVFVTGLVDSANHRGAISLLLVLPSGSLPPTTLRMLSAQAAGAAHNEVGQAAYSLRLLDSGGAVLVERTLSLTPLDDHSAEGASALFSDLFPQPSGQVATIQLLADGTVVDTRSVGSAAPTAAIQQPAAGAVIDSQLDIQWTASDANTDDRLLFTVQYSHDAGASWQTLALNLPGGPEPSHSLSLSGLSMLHGSAANGALIRVLASDGYNTTIATSAPFTLKDRLPEPVISAPATGQTFAAGQAVALSGGATDAEDGGLVASALSWQVDAASQGSGPDLAVAGLAPGAHTATLSASDSQGQTATATASFSIAPLSVPLAAAPALDGGCEDASYAGGSSLALKPYGDGSQASLRLLRSADQLWACFSGLQPGAALSAAFVGLYIDSDNSRDQLAQAGDAGFFIGEDGAVFRQAGDGAGGYTAAG